MWTPAALNLTFVALLQIATKMAAQTVHIALLSKTENHLLLSLSAKLPYQLQMTSIYGPNVISLLKVPIKSSDMGFWLDFVCSFC